MKWRYNMHTKKELIDLVVKKKLDKEYLEDCKKLKESDLKIIDQRFWFVLSCF